MRALLISARPRRGRSLYLILFVLLLIQVRTPVAGQHEGHAGHGSSVQAADDRRYNFEFNPWNSGSIRLTVAPNKAWTMQYSYGFQKDPEFFEPGNTHRQTASVQFNKPFDGGNLADSTDLGSQPRKTRWSNLSLEQLSGRRGCLDRNYIYSRIESVDREGEDLLTHGELHDLGFDDEQHPQFQLQASTLGAARDLWNSKLWSFAIGGDATLCSKPQVLDRSTDAIRCPSKSFCGSVRVA